MNKRGIFDSSSNRTLYYIVHLDFFSLIATFKSTYAKNALHAFCQMKFYSYIVPNLNYNIFLFLKCFIASIIRDREGRMIRINFYVALIFTIAFQV